MTYKHHIFLSMVEAFVLNESQDPNRISFLDLLLEAPIDDATVSKMIASKKQVSVYYQGDGELDKGWYGFQPINVKKKGNLNNILGYIVPKDGSNPTLKYLIQDRIVNWNVLGKKDADLSKEYEKKLFKFFRNPKLPKETKKAYIDKLKKVGIDVGNFLKKSAATVALSGALLMPFKDTVGEFLRQKAPHVVQVFSTKDLRSTDFSDSQKEVLGKLIANAIKDGQKSNKGSVTYNQYRKDIKADVMKGNMMSKEQIWNQLKQDPEVLMALTLGQFSYKKTDSGNYLVTDTYDFSKWKSISTTKEDIKNLPYPLAIAKIIKDNEGANLYTAIRHMAYLENPDDKPGAESKKVSVIIPAKYVDTYNVKPSDIASP